MYVFPFDPFSAVCTSSAKGPSDGAATSCCGEVEVRRQVCYQRTRNGGLGILESHWLAEKLTFQGRTSTGNMMERKWRKALPALTPTPEPRAVEGQSVNHHFSSNAAKPFVAFLGPVTFFGLGRSYIGI